MKGYVDPSQVSTEMVEILRPDGTLVPDHGHQIDLKEEDLRALWRVMVLTRELDQEGTNLQRQGELGVYTPCLGQEAIQAAAAYALEPKDWVFPSYRELGFAVHRGVEPSHILHLFRGTWHGGLFDYRDVRIAPYSVPIATQLLHATGFATGIKMDGGDAVVVGCCGDGGTSEGDFHEALNYAGVWHVPAVFLVQNNGYAISVPLRKQTAAPTLAVRALGYGMQGVRVDGNDVLASYVVMRDAYRHARSGEGPVLVEAMTYRRGPHSTADDPTRYRTSDEVSEWELKDPIARFTRYCENEGVLTEDFRNEVLEEAKAKRTKLRADIVGAGPLDPSLLFEHVYSERPPALEKQYEAFRRDYLQEG